MTRDPPCLIDKIQNKLIAHNQLLHEVLLGKCWRAFSKTWIFQSQLVVLTGLPLEAVAIWPAAGNVPDAKNRASRALPPMLAEMWCLPVAVGLAQVLLIGLNRGDGRK